MKKNEMSKTSELFFEYLSVCKELHVPAKEKYAYLDSKKEFESEDEKLAHLQEMIAFVKNTYHEIPMEQFLAEVNESQDWQELKYYSDLYWTNIDELLDDAVRFGADRVVRGIAPHVLFDNEKRLTECLAQAPNEATRTALAESFIPRRDEDYAMYPFCMVWNEITWKSHEDRRVCRLVSFADGIQDKIWQGFLNRYAFGSELLFFEHVTARYAVDREHTGIEWAPDRVMPLVHAMGYRLCSDGFEQMQIPAYWQKNYDDRRYTAIDKIWYSASALGLVLKKIGWKEKRDDVVNAFGVTGYTYLESVPEIEQRITDEDRILKLFHAAFNGKIPWSDIVPLMSENCHYYSDGSGKDITGRGQIVAFLEELNRRINTPDLQCHAHYARLKKPECDPKLLEHKEGERVLAIWQGELGEYYDCVVFFSINEEGLVDDICLRKDSRYIFRPFVPFEDDD